MLSTRDTRITKRVNKRSSLVQYEHFYVRMFWQDDETMGALCIRWTFIGTKGRANKMIFEAWTWQSRSVANLGSEPACLLVRSWARRLTLSETRASPFLGTLCAGTERGRPFVRLFLVRFVGTFDRRPRNICSTKGTRMIERHSITPNERV